MNRDQLTRALQQLAVDWNAGDRESAELQCCGVVRALHLLASRRAYRRDAPAATDLLTRAHAGLTAAARRDIPTRRAFVRACIRAMTHWLQGHASVSWRRRPLLSSGARGRPGRIDAAVKVAGRLEQRHGEGAIAGDDAWLFLCHRLAGLSPADLAHLFGTSEQIVAEGIAWVSTVVEGGVSADGVYRPDALIANA